MMGEHTTRVLVHLASGIRVEGATDRYEYPYLQIPWGEKKFPQF